MTLFNFRMITSLAVAFVCLNLTAQTTGPAPQVILKLDDMKHKRGELVSGWQMTLAYLDEKNIPASIGLVCNTLDNPPEAYVASLKTLDSTGRYEFWNHGWSHTRDKDAGTYEFKGNSYEYQAERFARSQQIARDILGIELIGFGAPYNQTDESTAKLLGEHPEIQWWMYPPRKAIIPDGVMPFYRIGKINIEIPVHSPNPEALREAFPLYRDQPVLVIQGHPMSWDQDDRFEKFKEIIEFLESQGCTFVLPRDLVKPLPATEPD